MVVVVVVVGITEHLQSVKWITLWCKEAAYISRYDEFTLPTASLEAAEGSWPSVGTDAAYVSTASLSSQNP